MRPALVVCLLATPVFAQAPTAPVVNPRGVINAFTQQPTPSPVSPGGIIWINGINLGPAAGWKAEAGAALPTTALDPPIEVRIGQRAIPLYSITPSRIVAQVPVDTPQGVTQIVVRRGEQQSAPARFTVVQPSPAISTELGGFGPAGTVSGNEIKLRVAGLGQTDPPTAPGALPAADTAASPRIGLRAYVGGMPAAVSAQLSAAIPGEFEVSVEVPPTAADGEVITVMAGNSAGNRVTYNTLPAPKVEFLPLPENTSNLRAMTASDLRPGFLVLNGPRAEDGCYPSLLVDFDAGKAEALPGCPTTATQQLISPFAASNDGHALAALAGPPEGDAASGVSAKVTLLQPGAETREIELPAKAATIGAGQGGNINAILPGTPIRIAQIDVASGEVTEGAAGGGGALARCGG